MRRTMPLFSVKQGDAAVQTPLAATVEAEARTRRPSIVRPRGLHFRP
jgi:hypothetical protein